MDKQAKSILSFSVGLVFLVLVSFVAYNSVYAVQYNVGANNSQETFSSPAYSAVEDVQFLFNFTITSFDPISNITSVNLSLQHLNLGSLKINNNTALANSNGSSVFG